jgi:hypothetical protein
MGRVRQETRNVHSGKEHETYSDCFPEGTYVKTASQSKSHMVRFQLKYSITTLNWNLVIRNSNNPVRLGSSGKFVENSTKLNCLTTTGYRIKYSTVLWLIELHISRCRKV